MDWSTIDVSLWGIKLKRERKDGALRRVAVLTVQTPFDDELAESLGGPAAQLCAAADQGEISAVAFPLSLAARVEIVSGNGDESIEIPVARGQDVKVSTSDKHPPQAKISIEFPWTDDELLFLSRHLGTDAMMTVREIQMSLLDDQAA